MGIQIKERLVKEQILDEKGRVIGELKFNPNDSRIMSKLSKVAKDIEKAIKEIKNIKITGIPTEDLENTEDFESVSESIDKIYKICDIETKTVDGVITELSEVFGKDTVELFTGGTSDIDSLSPLLDFIMPYVKEAREGKVSKYVVETTSEEADVME